MPLQKTDYYKQILNNQLQELLDKRSGASVREIVEIAEQAPDFIDQATIESDLDINIHMRERDSKLIKKIKQALERIEDGTYGICDDCGEEISSQRLKARPVTTVCIDCKKRQEAGEKQRGL